MAVKGSIAKQEIGEIILQNFKDSFYFNGGKEIRIPWEENGSTIQIKIQMTAAKDNVYPDGAGEIDAPAVSEGHARDTDITPTSTLVEPTEEEKHNVEALLKALNL